MVTRLAAALLVLGAVAGLRMTDARASTLTGDVNGDCTVSVADIGLVASRYGGFRGSLLYVQAYDLDHDGRIGVADIQIVASQFGESC